MKLILILWLLQGTTLAVSFEPKAFGTCLGIQVGHEYLQDIVTHMIDQYFMRWNEENKTDTV